jgi:hypothetical protein
MRIKTIKITEHYEDGSSGLTLSVKDKSVQLVVESFGVIGEVNKVDLTKVDLKLEDDTLVINYKELES